MPDVFSIDPNGVLRFPSGHGGERAVALDMAKIFRAEARFVELRGVTRSKAGELLHCFIEARREAREHHARATNQLLIAKRVLKQVRAHIVLDEGPQRLKDKGLWSTRSPAGSEDLREAVVVLDVNYQAAAERLEQIQAAVDYLETKVDAIYMAYFSIKTLVDPYEGKVDRISGGAGDAEPGELTEAERVAEFVGSTRAANPKSYAGTGFGAPKI